MHSRERPVNDPIAPKSFFAGDKRLRLGSAESVPVIANDSMQRDAGFSRIIDHEKPVVIAIAEK